VERRPPASAGGYKERVRTNMTVIAEQNV